MYKEGLCNNNKNFVARVRPKLPVFGIELKIYLIGRNVSLFENGKKVINHSTLYILYIHILSGPLGYSLGPFIDIYSGLRDNAGIL